MNFPTLLLYLCLTGLFVFPWIWVLASKTFAKKSGWARLAKNFADPSPDSMAKIARVSAKVGEVSYKDAVHVEEGELGLRLQMHPLLKFGHPPLLLPWSEVKVISELSPSEVTLLELGQVQQVRLEIAHFVLNRHLQ